MKAITKMSNLDLPNLRELFLHRNAITSMGGLSGCPRLKKLWLFQNKISELSDLHSVPELQELWIQANNITSLEGLDHSQQIQNLGLSGNPINDYSEVKKLAALTNLRDLSLSDIHFGRCPVTDEPGYKEFVLCYLRQVRILDGVPVKAEKQAAAEAAYVQQVRAYRDAIGSIEDSYRQELMNIETQQKSRENHAMVLEREMSSALHELQKLVFDGRAVIAKDVERQGILMKNNLEAFEHSLNEISKKTQAKLKQSKHQAIDNYDQQAALFTLLERITAADAAVVETLCDISEQLVGALSSLSGAVEMSPNRKGKSTSSTAITESTSTPSVIFTNISPNTPDFQYISQLINSKSSPSNTKSIKSKTSSTATGEKPVDYSLELVKLYYLHSLPSWASCSIPSDKRDDSIRVYTILRIEKFADVLRSGWESLGESSVCFCSSSEVAAALHGSLGSSFDYEPDSTQAIFSSSTSNGGESPPIPIQTADMHRLAAALDSKMLLMLCCKLNLKRAGVANKDKEKQRLVIPHSEQSREEMIIDLKKTRKAIEIDVDFPSTNNTSTNKVGSSVDNVLYAIPASLCSAAVKIDYASICVTPMIEGGSRSIESKIDILMMPHSDIDRNARYLVEFEEEMAASVKRYMDQLLEEVDDNEASALRRADSEIVHKEASLRNLKDDIEKERRQQEGLLRDMRQFVDGGGGNSGAGNNAANANKNKKR